MGGAERTVRFEECKLGEHENRQQLQIVDLAGKVAQAVAEQITQRVKREVARQLAVFFRTQASAAAGQSGNRC